MAGITATMPGREATAAFTDRKDERRSAVRRWADMVPMRGG